MSWQIQQSINIGYRDPFRTVCDFLDIVARPNFSFLQHAEVESRPVMCYEQGRHPRFVHANTDAVASYARLAHFKYRATNAVLITNADFVVRKFLNREVFSELAEDEVIPSEKAFPVVIGV